MATIDDIYAATSDSVNRAGMPVDTGPLAALPLANCDFASACYTSKVSRAHLFTVLVRVVACVDGDAQLVDMRQCCTLAFLFDGRKSVPALRAAIDSACQSVRIDADRSRRMDVYTRIPYAKGSAVLPVLFGDCTTASVGAEVAIDRGVLRGAVHRGSALRAYKTHCDRPCSPPLCTQRAVLTLRNWQAMSDTQQRAMRALPRMYAEGLRVLTRNGEPTDTVPAAAQCSGTSQCNCFMWRAMYRGGAQWLLLYAVLPPHTLPTRGWETLGAPVLTRAAWLERLGDEHVSQSYDDTEDDASAGGHIFGSIAPSAWPHTATEYAVQCICDLQRQELIAETSESASDSASASYHARPPLQTSLLELACMWALSTDRRCRTKQVLRHAISVVGVYHTTALRHVLMRLRRKTFFPHLLQHARELAASAGDAPLFALMHAHDTVLAALHAALDVHVRGACTTLAECVTSGCRIAALLMLMHCCSELSGTLPCRSVNNWSQYTRFDPLYKSAAVAVEQ